ncbi:MAG: hypothetical protein WCB80_23500, partial [Mycobacterium sp.]
MNGTPFGRRPPRRRRHRIALPAGAAAAIAAIVGIVLVVALTGNNERRSSLPAAAPSSTAKPGPFTGVYRADFGPSTTNGKADDGATPSTGEWSVRSACRPTGCVATATAKDG